MPQVLRGVAEALTGTIDFDYTDKMAQELFAALRSVYEAMRKYRALTLKDNYKLEQAENSLRDTLAYFEAGTITWKVSRGS